MSKNMPEGAQILAKRMAMLHYKHRLTPLEALNHSWFTENDIWFPKNWVEKHATRYNAIVEQRRQEQRKSDTPERSALRLTNETAPSPRESQPLRRPTKPTSTRPQEPKLGERDGRSDSEAMRNTFTFTGRTETTTMHGGSATNKRPSSRRNSNHSSHSNNRKSDGRRGDSNKSSKADRRSDHDEPRRSNGSRRSSGATKFLTKIGIDAKNSSEKRYDKRRNPDDRPKSKPADRRGERRRNSEAGQRTDPGRPKTEPIDHRRPDPERRSDPTGQYSRADGLKESRGAEKNRTERRAEHRSSRPRTDYAEKKSDGQRATAARPKTDPVDAARQGTERSRRHHDAAEHKSSRPPSEPRHQRRTSEAGQQGPPRRVATDPTGSIARPGRRATGVEEEEDRRSIRSQKGAFARLFSNRN